MGPLHGLVLLAAGPVDPVAADREGRLHAVKESGRHGSALARWQAAGRLSVEILR